MAWRLLGPTVPPVENNYREQERPMAAATLTLSSKNYSSWSMRGWLMASWQA